ncbi:spermatogenesis-associated serine-rich protein 1 isoform X1 [Anolis carolinensis]|uniref:spermatogenesis-associated serine-rich protein 1 isoform X1 n=1 Tax=Anolis carolinensis TaxID=28377 RepID=UPI002F2B7CAD
MKEEGRAESPGDNEKEPSNDKIKSTGLQEQDSTLNVVPDNNGSQENPDTPSKTSTECSPTECKSSLISNSGPAASPQQPSIPSHETNVVEESSQLVKHPSSSPQENVNSSLEWTFYPTSGNITYYTGKKCIFDGIYMRNKTTSTEKTLEMCTGRKKFVDEIASRNGIPLVTPGDHPYATPEQSPDFHKTGSTRSPVYFGSAVYKKKSDTFIPLQRLPETPSVPFRIKEKQQELEREKAEVRNLDYWKPAPTLLHSFFASSLNRRLTYQ